MRTKKIIILSISSDIAFKIAEHFIKKKFKIIGTYKTQSDNVEKLKLLGVKLYKLDLGNKKKIDQVAKKISQFSNNNWDYFISFAGKLDPVEKIIKSNSDVWEKSIYVNSLGQIRFLKKILYNNSKKRKILFFSGSGTNGPKIDLSAYTLSKILLIKFVELLDSEEKLLTTCILGPGFIDTKIHKIKTSPLSQERKKSIEKMIEFITWLFQQPKNVVSGRNFSLNNDLWKNEKIKKLLLKDNNIYKLRRFGNETKIK